MRLRSRIYLVERYIEREFKAGNIPGSVHLSFGQIHLDADLANFDGWVLGNHRSHGQYLARTDDIPGLLEQVYGGMSQHLYSPGKFLSTGIQGALTGVAVGLASQGERVRCFLGDGTVNQGILWESLGICEGLPVTFIIYDNQYSMSKTSKSWLHDNIIHHPNVQYYVTFRACGHSGNDTQMYRSVGELDVCHRYHEDVRPEELEEINSIIYEFEKRNKRNFAPIT